MEAPHAGPQILPQISILFFPVIAIYQKDPSGLIEAVVIFMGRVILYVTTARDEWWCERSTGRCPPLTRSQGAKRCYELWVMSGLMVQ